MLSFIAIYCLIVIAHVYYSYYFPNKVIVAIKKKLVKKIFSLQRLSDRRRATALLISNTRRFAYLAIFTPNQLYYASLGSILTFWLLKDAGGMILWLGLAFFCLTILISIILQYFFFKKELSFQKPLERENKKDNFLVDNRDLIIKKNLVSSSLHDYDNLLSDTQNLANKRDFSYTLSWVIPSYSLGQVGGFIFLPFASQDLVAYQRIVKLSESTKKFTERLRDYPAGLAAQKRINKFLALPERDDIQKNILITEPITEIELKKVSFAYEKNNPILKNSD
jgi:ABC-type multidrug transport system fused ATPase/permease subunit